jgi:opacity protein-like surface antigen
VFRFRVLSIQTEKNNMRKSFALCAMLFGALAVSAANADFILFDIDANPGAWDRVVSGLQQVNCWDFNDDADYGIIGGDGPVGSGGNQFISPGLLPDKIVLDSEQDGPGGGSRGPGGTGLVGVGPSAGFGNADNAVLANFFVDAFGIDFSEKKLAFEFNALTLLGSDAVTIIASDENTGQRSVFQNVRVGAGRRLGILAKPGGAISHISIYDAGGGAEGIQGVAWSYIIPEPGSAALLGFLALGMMIRRRR